MSQFDTAIREAEAEVKRSRDRLASLTKSFDAVEQAVGSDTDIAIDIDNATLDDVRSHNETMNHSIAELIIGLDSVTSEFSSQFDQMRQKTGWESFVGFFSSAKSESMREQRVRTASIDDKLQDLIGKSDIIVNILQGQMDALTHHREKVEVNLKSTLSEREAVVETLENVKAQILAMDPAVIELENKISVEQDPAARTRLETELAEMNARYNELVKAEQVDLAKSQTLERYIEKGKSWVDSLQNQLATQMVLINKLQTDTKQRVVLYDALTKSLKTAQQQDIAHRINEIGVETDKQAQAAMAAIGSATQHRMAEMMEAHEDQMVFARKVLEEKAKSDERFARRFGDLMEKHDKNLYGNTSP